MRTMHRLSEFNSTPHQLALSAEILWEAMAPPEGPLLLLKVLYDDQQGGCAAHLVVHSGGPQRVCAPVRQAGDQEASGCD